MTYIASSEDNDFIVGDDIFQEVVKIRSVCNEQLHKSE